MLINFWAVILCVVIAMVLGGLWYGPWFGKPWMHMMGITRESMSDPAKKKKVWKSYVLMAVAAFIMTLVLARSVLYGEAYTHTSGLMLGLASGFWAWLGFVATTTVGMVLWEGKPWKLWAIVAGYYLVLLLISGAILSVWH